MDVNPGTIGERAGARSTPWAALLQLAGPWRVFLGTSAGWLVISVIVLRFTLVSVALAGVVVGVVFLLGAFGECLIAAAKARRGREGSAAAASRDHDGAPRIARCWSDSVCAADMVQPARTAKTGDVTWHGLRRLGVRHVMDTSRERESFAQLTDRALGAC